MTKATVIRQSELKRMAEIAKREGVTVWLEIDGRTFGVSPIIPANNKPEKVEIPDDFAL